MRRAAPEDLSRHTLLHDAVWRDDWALWLNKANVSSVDPKKGPAFSLYSLALQAAIDGGGVLIGHEMLIGPFLKKRQLVAPFALRVPNRKRLTLLSPNRIPQFAADVVAWLKSEATEAVSSEHPAPALLSQKRRAPRRPQA